MPVNVKITYNTRVIHDVAKQAAMKDKRLEALAYANVKRRFNSNVNELVNDFEEHQFSQDLAGGNEARSKFLTDGGSLYSFIGIRHPYKPIDEMVQYLRTNLKLPDNRNQVPITKKPTRTGIQMKFDVQIVSKDDLFTVGAGVDGASEWGQRNWLYVAMNPPKNYNHYFYSSKFENKSRSRSKRAIQSKYVVRNTSIGFFAPKDYLVDMLKEFKSKITT